MQQIPQKKQGSYMGIGGMVIAFGIFARANLWRRHYSGPIMETYIPVCTSDRFDCLVDRAFFYRTKKLAKQNPFRLETVYQFDPGPAFNYSCC